MHKHSSVAIAICLLLFLLILLPNYHVRAISRTIVVPDNYKTITDAVGNTTDGDIILVRSGVYNEQSLKSNHSISLIGQNVSNTIINLNPPIVNYTILYETLQSADFTIKFNADNCVMSGFTINSGGPIEIIGNNEVFTNNIVSNFAQFWQRVTGNYNIISNNTLTASAVISVKGDASAVCGNTGLGSVIIDGFSKQNNVFNNYLGSISGAGESSSNLYYGNIVKDGKGMFTSLNDIVANNTIVNCTQGISTSTNNLVEGNLIANITGVGLTISNLNVLVFGNHLVNNGVGIQAVTFNPWHSGNFTVYSNAFVNNNRQVQLVVSNSTSFAYYPEARQGGLWRDDWNSSQSGNFWSDYAGADSNNDGIGDTPYYITGGDQDNRPLTMPADISTSMLQLPSWANINLPNQVPTPPFPAKSSSSSSPSQTLSQTKLAQNQPPNFAVGLTAEINGYSSTCVFGVNINSSVLYDSKYDSLSPYQASGILASLSYNNQSAFLTQALSQYIVPSNGSTIWRLRIYSFDQAGIVTLTWNNTSIESMALNDPIFLKEYANMNTKNSYSFNMTSGGIANFNIIYQSRTTTPTPTASVPEFSWLTILTILLTITITLAVVRKRLPRNVC